MDKAHAEWTAHGRLEQILILRWAVGRCLLSLGRYEQEFQAANQACGYLFEEIAENLAALGKTDAARPYFQKALEELGQDRWFASHEPAKSQPDWPTFKGTGK